jgi:restriction system protein
MARSRSTKRQSRALNTLQEKGFVACALGVGMLLVPFFMGASPIVAAITNALRPAGWLALATGLGMLALHRFAKSKASQPDPLPSTAAQAPKPKERTARRDIRPDIAANADTQSKTTPNTPERATSWSPAVFASIEWRRFEAVCEKLFAQAGFETKSQSHGADGGVDIWLHSSNAQGPVAVVQCKHWQGKAVGVKELREFFGVMASHQLKRGTYATTSTYTADAQQFAKDNGINALNGAGLLALIAKRTPEQQQALLDVAYEGEYWRPTCASCGIKLVERNSAKSSNPFWGCRNYPRCRSRLTMTMATATALR